MAGSHLFYGHVSGLLHGLPTSISGGRNTELFMYVRVRVLPDEGIVPLTYSPCRDKECVAVSNCVDVSSCPLYKRLYSWRGVLSLSSCVV